MALSDALSGLKNLPPQGTTRGRTPAVRRSPCELPPLSAPVSAISPETLSSFGDDAFSDGGGAAPSLSMTPTPEQECVLASSADLLKINAYAGTGKTSTFQLVTRANPRLQFLYVAFNRSIREEAARKFPPNVRCMTTHGLAFPKFGSIYQNAGKIDNLRLVHFVDSLRLRGKKDPWLFASLVKKTVENFIADASPFPSKAHLPVNDLLLLGPTKSGFYPPDEIVSMATRFWDFMRDESNRNVPMTHDGYLKLFSVSGVELPYDVLLLDEAQDSSPAFLACFLSQQARRFLVGDDAQAIYSFRGAINAMAQAEGAEELYLTKSWRFGEAIADAANSILIQKGKTVPLRGDSNVESALLSSAPPLSNGYALIARTNSTLFDEAVRLAGQGRRIHFVGGVPQYDKDFVVDLVRLRKRQEPQNPLLKAFASYDDFKEAASLAMDADNMARCRLVDEYGDTLPNLLDRVINAHSSDPSKAHIILSTAHKSKGLEYDVVYLAEDFLFSNANNGHLGSVKPEENEEANILYVAFTRAKRCLHVNPRHMDMIRVFRKGMTEPKSIVSAEIRAKLERFKLGDAAQPRVATRNNRRI